MAICLDLSVLCHDRHACPTSCLSRQSPRLNSHETSLAAAHIASREEAGAPEYRDQHSVVVSLVLRSPCPLSRAPEGCGCAFRDGQTVFNPQPRHLGVNCTTIKVDHPFFCGGIVPFEGLRNPLHGAPDDERHQRAETQLSSLTTSHRDTAPTNSKRRTESASETFLT